MSSFLEKHPTVKTITLQMETGYLGIIVDNIPQSMPCERSSCHAHHHNVWEWLGRAIQEHRSEGNFFLMCSAMERMNRTHSRQCMASQRGTFKIEYHDTPTAPEAV